MSLPLLQNPSVKPAVRSEAAFAKEFPVSSGSQHRKKEEDGVYGEWMPVEKKTDKAGAPVASAGAEDQSKASDSVFPEAPSQVSSMHFRLMCSFLNLMQDLNHLFSFSSWIPLASGHHTCN